MRDTHERELDSKRVEALDHQAEKRGLFRSGWYLKQRSDLRTQFADALAYGYIEEALATCQLHDVPLTPQFCALLEDAAKQLLASLYNNIIRLQGSGLSDDFRIPVSAMQQMNSLMRAKQFSIMPKISIMIETTRIADEKRRAHEMADKTSKIQPPKRFAVGTRVRVRNPGIDGTVTEMDNERTVLAQYWHTIETKQGTRREPGSNLELIPEPITNATSSATTTNYIQHVNQHGIGNSVSQFGDVHTNALQIGDVTGLKQELATIRAALKAQPASLETDELLGSLASAEKPHKVTMNMASKTP